MIKNGTLPYGHFGPSGQVEGQGWFWSPDLFPQLNVFNESMKTTELEQFHDHRSSLLSYQYSDYAVIDQGGKCYPPTADDTVWLFPSDLLRVTVDAEETEIAHYAMVRYPRNGSLPPEELDIVLLLHGRGSPVAFNSDWAWFRLLHQGEGARLHYADNCIIVIPLYFSFRDFEFRFSLPNQSQTDCGFELSVAGIPTFSEADYIAPVVPQVQGLTEYDWQIMSVLQTLAAVRDNWDTQTYPPLSNRLFIAGGSMGGLMTYNLSTLLHDNPNHQVYGFDVRGATALFGITDMMQPIQARRQKTYLASLMKKGSSASGIETFYSYTDIADGLASRTRAIWNLYKNGTIGYDGLRLYMLQFSVANYFRYNSGPFPLLVMHGTSDPTIYVEHSRWLAEQMRLHGVAEDDFTYIETPFAGHGKEQLNGWGTFTQLFEDVMG